jgi:hypothetical protein
MVVVRWLAKQRSIWVCLDLFAPLFASRQKVENKYDSATQQREVDAETSSA